MALPGFVTPLAKPGDEASVVRRVLLIVAAAVLFNSLVVAYGFLQINGLQERLTTALLMTVPSNAAQQARRTPGTPSADESLAVVFYSDLGCEYCRQSSAVIDSLRHHFGDAVRWVYAPLPRPPHIAEGSFASARLLLCAAHHEAGWIALREAARGADDGSLQPIVREVLTREGFPKRRMDQCATGDQTEQRTWQAVFAASRAGVSAVPTTVVDGLMMEGVVQFGPMRSLIESRLASR